MELSTVFPSAIIDIDGFYVSWAGLGFTEAGVPSTEHFYKAFLFQLQKQVPNQSFFDFSTSSMSLVTQARREVFANNQQFIESGFTLNFYSLWAASSLDPDVFVGDEQGIVEVPVPVPVPTPVPVPDVSPFIESTTSSVVASSGDKLWLQSGVTELVLPELNEGIDVGVFNNSGLPVTSELNNGVLEIPDQELVLFEVNNDEWTYESMPNVGLVFTPNPLPTTTISLNSNAVSHSMSDVIDLLARDYGQQSWTNPHDAGLVTVSMSSVGNGSPRELVNKAIGDNFLAYSAGQFYDLRLDPQSKGIALAPSQFFIATGQQPGQLRATSIIIQGGNVNEQGGVEWETIVSVNPISWQTFDGKLWAVIDNVNTNGKSYERFRFRGTNSDTQFQPQYGFSEFKLGGELIIPEGYTYP